MDRLDKKYEMLTQLMNMTPREVFVRLIDMRGVDIKHLKRMASKTLEDHINIQLHGEDTKIRNEVIQKAVDEVAKLIAKRNGLSKPELSQPIAIDYNELVQLTVTRRQETASVIQSEADEED